jgi:lipopolysaccharide transport system ATP-binding protein
MSKITICAKGIGKKYWIGQSMPYRTLADTITDTVKAPIKAIKSSHDSNTRSPTEFWALKDVSFDVKQGEVVGIIGKNGAGKSTLLKILSRITSPTEGNVRVYGKIGSLLEVGTGFHPELTGRENIFLSGSILGMRKCDIEDNFNQIVKFSEIEKFIDTPVKRYSSGMYVRLAFAVAAHLESEILLIDEVLAVGDASFQKKCLGKMEDITEEGKTILFISHNLTAVKSLCNRSIVIEAGRITFNGDTDEAIDFYLRSDNLSKGKKVAIAEHKRENHCSLRAKIVEITLVSDNKINPEIIDPFKPLIIQLKISSDSDVRCSATLYVADELQNFCMFDSSLISQQDIFLKPGINSFECRVSPLNLFAGNYIIKCELNIHGQEIIDRVPNAYPFSINSCDPKGSGYNLVKGYHGVFYVNHEWKKDI